MINIYCKYCGVQAVITAGKVTHICTNNPKPNAPKVNLTNKPLLSLDLRHMDDENNHEISVQIMQTGICSCGKHLHGGLIGQSSIACH